MAKEAKKKAGDKFIKVNVRKPNEDINLDDLIQVPIEGPEPDDDELEVDYEEQQEDSQKLINSLNRAKSWDVWTQIWMRVILTVSFLVILGIQNFKVFEIVSSSLEKNNLTELQPILITLIGGTLIETYYVIKIIVRWAMKEIDWQTLKNS